MLKLVIAVTAMLAMAAPSFVYAQQSSDSDARFEQQHPPSAEDIKAFADARIAGLKAGLQLTPDQEKNWPPFEQAIRDLIKLRIQGIRAREAASEQQPPSNPFDRMQHRADAMSRFGAALKLVADAGSPLYQSLDDAQKHRFTFLAHMLRPHWIAGGDFWETQRECGNYGCGPHGMMSRAWDNGPHGMMGGPNGMMGREWDNGSHGMSPGDDEDDR